MKTITKKSELIFHLNLCLEVYHTSGLEALANEVKSQLLDYKIRFPLLEYCGQVCFRELPSDQHLPFCTLLQEYKTIGENVITGIILQQRLTIDLNESFMKAVEYLEQAHIWYICDIIGERVFGYGLRHYPEVAFPLIRKIVNHPVNWVRRGLGAGFHYAIKKGLNESYSQEVFKLLLTMATSKDKEIRQGIGWAAKTTAKFHPVIIERFSEQIEDPTEVANWFRRKVAIGLERNRHASRS